MDQFLESFHINITLAKVFLSLIIIGITIMVHFFFVRIYERFIHKKSTDLNSDPTNYKFLRHAISALIYIVGIAVAIYTIPVLRTLAGSMLAGSAILAVAIGFASQQAFSNIIGGIFIIIFKPFRVNDRIQIKETITGMVEDITLRHTVIRNFENRRVIIPNSVISQETLVNADFVDEKICKTLEIGIGYSSSIDLARKIIQEEALKHPFCLDNRTPEQNEEGAPQVVVRVIGWADSSIQLKVWVWAADAPSAFVMSCDLFESIKNRFDLEGIEIPFPYRNVVQKSN